MDIFLIRHTTPAVTYGTCYGFADLDLAATFPEEAGRVQGILPDKHFSVYASPLQRCSKLATFLFGSTFETDERLKEVNFGDWEMKTWEEIPETTPKNWMADYLHEPVPNGESYTQLYARSIAAFRDIIASGQDTAIVTHGGVIRSIVAYATGTPIDASYDIRVEYGRVVHLHLNEEAFEVKGINI
jgi:alpha-ribazole phosphatase